MAEAYGKTSRTPDPDAGGDLVRTDRTRPDLPPGLEAGDRTTAAMSRPAPNILPIVDNKKVDDMERISTEPAGLGTSLARLPQGVKQALPAKVSYLALYRYADTWDLVVVATSAVCAIAAGAALPLLSVWLTFCAFRWQ